MIFRDQDVKGVLNPFMRADHQHRLARKKWDEFVESIRDTLSKPQHIGGQEYNLPAPEGDELRITWAGLVIECRFEYLGDGFALVYGNLEPVRDSKEFVPRFRQHVSLAGCLLRDDGSEVGAVMGGFEDLHLIFIPGCQAALEATWKQRQQ